MVLSGKQDRMASIEHVLFVRGALSMSQTSAASIPVQLKPILPFLQRAEELEKQGHDNLRVIAYYCRSYAVRSHFCPFQYEAG